MDRPDLPQGGETRSTIVRRPLELSDFHHLDFVGEVFLPEARARAAFTPQQDALLTSLLGELFTEASGRLAPPPRAVPQPPATPAPAPEASLAAPLPISGAPVPAPPRAPSPTRLWWERTLQAVGSDLAVNGLAYLGVLLFFVGAFGLVAFAFGEVATGLRPVAELVIAVTPFAAGALLRRRRAEAVGRALEIAGGLVLPVMLITSVLDGVSVPPDLTGPALVSVLTVTLVALAGAYALWSRRVPDSALRYLVAPVCWLATGIGTMGIGGGIPAGKAVATPSATQVAAMAVALLITLGWARLRPGQRLAGATTTAAVPGLVGIALLALLTWTAEGWPVAPLLVAGIALLAGLELLADRVPEPIPTVAAPVWWLVTLGGLLTVATEPGQIGAVGALGALGFIGILERAGDRRLGGLALPAVGLFLALAATFESPAWATGAFFVTAAWATLRRMRPYRTRRAPLLLDVVAALALVLALYQLALVVNPPGALLSGAGVVLVMAQPVRRGWLDRPGAEGYWPALWTGVAALVTAVGVALLPFWTTRELWLLAAAFAVLAVATWVGPLATAARLPASVVLTCLTWLAAGAALGIQPDVRHLVLAGAGLAAVAAAHWIRWETSRSATAALALVGHGVGVVAVLLLDEPSWWFVAGVAAATAGWCLTGWRGATSGSPLVTELRSLHPVLGWLPLAVASVGLPATAGLAVVQAGVPSSAHPWVIVLGLTAVSYAAVTHVRLPEPAAVVASWAAFGAGVLTPLLGTDALASGLGCLALIGSTMVLEARRRRAVMTWVAWLAVAPAVFLLAQAWWPWFAGEPDAAQAVLAFTAVGGLTTVAGVLADQRGRADSPSLTPEHRWAVPPVAVGVLDLVAGVAVGAAFATDRVAGWACVVSAVAVLIVAFVQRAGVLAALGVLLPWWATFLLGGAFVPERPWIAVLVVLVLLVAAELASRGSTTGPWWARWDLPLVVAAAAVLLTGLVLSSGGPHASLVFGAGGLECIVVAARLRSRPTIATPLAVIGVALALVGAAWAGPGWLALSLLLVAVVLTLPVQRVGLLPWASGRTAVGFAASAAVVASWWSGLEWVRQLDVPTQTALDGSGLVAVAVLVAVAAGTRLYPAGRRVWLIWGGGATAVEVFVLSVALAPDALGDVLPGVGPSWWLAAAGVTAGVALATSASALRLAWLPEGGFAFVALALAAADRRLGLDVTAEVAVLSIAGAVAATALFAVAAARGDLHWRRGVAGLGLVLTIWALATAWTSAGAVGSSLLAAPLAVAAILLAALGSGFDRPEIGVFSPLAASAAFVAFALDTMTGEPQGVTVPVAVGVLVSVALWRHLRVRRDQSVNSREVVLVELLGITLLIAPALVQAVTDSLAYVLVGFLLAVSVTAWGVVTHVRRRLAAGGVAILASVVVLVGVPLVQLLPSWEGPALWALIGAVGLGAVLVAAFIERGREVAMSGLTRFREATRGWE